MAPSSDRGGGNVATALGQHLPQAVPQYRTSGNPGRVDLGGCPPKSPTDPGLHITRTRFLIS